jgi:hypothetical protein
MTTATSSANFSQAASGSPAGIQAWTGELVGQLIACGLVQTNDTGQLTISGSGASATTNATQPSGTGVANTVGYVCFTFNDTLAGGTLSTTALNNGGSGYDGGGTHTYSGITATGATSGATCTCTVTVTSGVCGNMGTIAASGSFIVGEKITIPNSSLGGSGSGASWTATALSSGQPVIFRLDFGGGGAVTDPQAWIRVGAGTNGAGAIAGSDGTSRMTQVACFQNSAPQSTSTPYTSYFCVNMTYGVAWAQMKYGGQSAQTYQSAGGFVLFRTSSSTGAASSSAICLMSNSATTTGSSGPACMQCMPWSSGAGSTIYPTLAVPASTSWGAGCAAFNAGNHNTIFELTSTLENSTVFVFPAYTISPAIAFSNILGNVLTGDVAQGTSFSATIIGSTALTYLQAAGICGSAYPSNTGAGANAGVVGTTLLYQ